MEYAGTITVIIHAYIISTRGLKTDKGSHVEKKTEIEADSYMNMT